MDHLKPGEPTLHRSFLPRSDPDHTQALWKGCLPEEGGILPGDFLPLGGRTQTASKFLRRQIVLAYLRRLSKIIIVVRIRIAEIRQSAPGCEDVRILWVVLLKRTKSRNGLIFRRRDCGSDETCYR